MRVYFFLDKTPYYIAIKNICCFSSKLADHEGHIPRVLGLVFYAKFMNLNIIIDFYC